MENCASRPSRQRIPGSTGPSGWRRRRFRPARGRLRRRTTGCPVSARGARRAAGTPLAAEHHTWEPDSDWSSELHWAAQPAPARHTANRRRLAPLNTRRTDRPSQPPSSLEFQVWIRAACTISSVRTARPELPPAGRVALQGGNEEGPGLKPRLIRAYYSWGGPRLKPWVTNPTQSGKTFSAPS